jgi:ferredoxin
VLSISPSMKRGVVSTDHGWTGPGLNVNDLLDRGMTGRGGLGYPFRALRCRLDGPVPPPDGLATSPGAGSSRVVRRYRTVWCTGCMACAVTCRMHTGRKGITIRMEDGELTPCLTDECIGCPGAPCVSVCHTRCLDGLFDD